MEGPDKAPRAPATLTIVRSVLRGRVALLSPTYAAPCGHARLPCGHEYHEACARRHRASSLICPLCRAPMPEVLDRTTLEQRKKKAGSCFAAVPDAADEDAMLTFFGHHNRA